VSYNALIGAPTLKIVFEPRFDWYGNYLGAALRREPRPPLPTRNLFDDMPAEKVVLSVSPKPPIFDYIGTAGCRGGF